MKRKVGRSLCGWAVFAVLASAWPSLAAGIEDFKLSSAIPADAMLVVQCRQHAGQQFVNEQFKRVWAAIEKQGFERDVKRLLRGVVKVQSEEPGEGFDEQWQRISDLASAVGWSRLCERECAVAVKLGMPMGAEVVVLLMPPEDQVAKDFEGLVAILKSLAELAPKELLVLTSEGAGDAAVHRLSWAQQVPPVGLTLARHKDVLLVGLGAGLVEQSLALLRGESDAKTATLASTERFKQALAQLPTPVDGLHFVDLAKWMGQVRGFSQMAVQMAALATTQPAEGEAPASPLGFLPRLVDEMDVWDYVAGVAATDGMKTSATNVVVLREDARSRPLRKALYGNSPIREPLKFIPRDAATVSVSSGFDLATLYKAVLDFVEREVPGGRDLLEKWKVQQEQIAFDFETDLLSWLGGGFAGFTMPARGTSYVTDWVYMVSLRDEQKAAEAFEDLCQRLHELLQPQGGAVDEAKVEGAEGFKAIMLPPIMAMMMPGQPVVGIKNGQLLIGSNAKVVSLALKTAAGEEENFSKSERFAKEGLPLGDKVTSFSFDDLSRRGEELGQALSMAGALQMFLPAEVQKDPAARTILSVLTKIGRVAKTLDFYRSSCSVTTFDGKVSLTREVTNYQEPPKKPIETAPAETPAEPEPTRAPAAEKPGS